MGAEEGGVVCIEERVDVEEADGKADSAWIARVKEEEKREMTKTEIDLRGYMSNLIKESIRVSSANS